MPNYLYRCTKCATEIDRPFHIGEAPRHQDCPRCGLHAHLVIGAGVHVAPSALESKGAQVRDMNVMEGEWNRDMPAYKRMRDRGLQPKSVDGAADLEDKVNDQQDIDLQRLFDKGVTKERVREGAEQAQMIVDSAAI